MSCQTFGAYWFSVPRRPLLQSVAQRICDRLVKSWAVHDTKARDAAIEAWVANQLTGAQLSAETLSSRLQETCATILGQTPAAFCEAVVAAWAKDGPADLARNPGVIGEALTATKMSPATNTPASAVWNERPIVLTTTKAKNALSPMPGAVATG